MMKRTRPRIIPEGMVAVDSLISRKKEKTMFQKRLDYFISNSSLNGVRFFASSFSRNDRIFWALVLIVSAIGMIVVFQLTIKTDVSDRVSINIDTAYLHWINNFPAISFCMEFISVPEKTGKVHHFIQTYFNEHNITIDMPPHFVDHIMNYVFISPHNAPYMEMEECFGENVNSTCGVDVDVIRNFLLPTNCKNIIFNIKYKGEYIENCDDIFKLQHTEIGTCLTANGVYFYDYDLSQLPLTYMRGDLQSLTFTFMIDDAYYVDLYVHSNEDFPNFQSEFKYRLITPNANYSLEIQTVETVNSAITHSESIEKRQCRFPHERWPENGSLAYSFASCLIYRRIQIEMEICNCTIHSSPEEYRPYYCSYKQFTCIRTNDILAKMLESHRLDPCLPSCTEMDITFIGYHTSINRKLSEIDEIIVNETIRLQYSNEISYSNFSLKIENTPTFRFIRNVNYTRLDFVVTIGGIVGLFFGASILGIVEIIHIWFIRRF